MALLPGHLVQVLGLKNASARVYNGAVGIVLTLPAIDQAGARRQKVRLCKHAGKVIHVREANISPSGDEPEWETLQDRLKVFGSVLNMICKSRLGDLESCDDFTGALWAEFAELSPAKPLILDPTRASATCPV